MSEAQSTYEKLAIRVRRGYAANRGVRSLKVRERPGVLDFQFRMGSVDWVPPTRTRGPGDAVEARDAGPVGEAQADSVPIVYGTASSTSVDWYGTELSKRGLESMDAQFSSERGVPLIPRHGSWTETVEWDDELGRTSYSEIKRGEVVNAYSAEEDGYTLTVHAPLDMEYSKSQELVRRLKKGQPIGLSIGGWFTELEIEFKLDDDGNIVEDSWGWPEIERIIVHEAELDHLAVVRNNANPDSNDLALMSPETRNRMRDLSKEDPIRDASPDPAPATRGTSNPQKVTSTPEIDNEPRTGNDSNEARAPEGAQEDTDMAENENNESVLDILRSMQEGLGGITSRLDSIEETQRSTDSRLKAVEEQRTAPTPAPTPGPKTEDRSVDIDAKINAAVEERTAAMRADLEQREAELAAERAAMADVLETGGYARSAGRAPTVVPRGTASSEARARTIFKGLIGECRSKKMTTLAVAAERHMEHLVTEPNRVRDHATASRMKADASGVLRSLLRAAEVDRVRGYYPRDEWMTPIA